MDTQIIDVITKSGMGVGAFVILCLISYSIIKHILTHDTSLRAFDHIREEHKDLDSNQKELTKVLRELSDSVDTVNKSLKETEQALGRINGYVR